MPSLQQEIRQGKDFESLEQETHLNLQRTHSLLMGPLFRFLKERDLSVPLYNILRILRGQRGEGLSCSRIGERMVTRVPDVTRLIDKLEKDGLVTRDRSRGDRRVVLIAITPRGLALLKELDAPMRDLHRRTLGHLTTAQMKELNRLLELARQPFTA